MKNAARKREPSESSIDEVNLLPPQRVFEKKR